MSLHHLKDYSLNKSIPKQSPKIDQNDESSPMLLKSNAPQLKLSQIQLTSPQQKLPADNPLPIRINHQLIHNNDKPQKYQRQNFFYNTAMDNIHSADFSSFNWKNSDPDDLLSFMTSTKQTPRDLARFIRNNHKSPEFIQTLNSYKLLEVAYFDAESGPLSQILFTSDRKLLISVSKQQEAVKIWQASDFRPLTTLEGFEETVTCIFCCFRSENLLTATASNIIVWDLELNRETRRLPFERTTKMVMNNQENLLFSASKDGRLRITDWKSGRTLQVIESNKGAAIIDFCLSPNEKLLAFCGRNQRISIYTLKTLNDMYYSSDVSLSVNNSFGYTQVIYYMDGNQEKFISLSEDGTVLLWALEQRLVERVLIPSNNQVLKMALMPDSKILVTFNKDKYLQLWNIENGKQLVQKKSQSTITDLTVIKKIGDNGNNFRYQIATSSLEGIVTVWIASEFNDVVNMITIDQPVREMVATKDNAYVIFSSENSIHIFDLASNRIEKTLIAHSSVTAICLAPDSKTLLSGGGQGDSTVKIWDLERGIAEETLKKHQEEVVAIAVDQNMEEIATGSIDQLLCIWDLKQRKLKFEARNTGLFKRIVFGNKGELFTGGKEGTIKHFKTHNLEEVRVFSAHAAEITGLEFLRKKEVLVSGSLDGMVKVWNCEGREVKIVKSIIKGEPIANLIVTMNEMEVIIVGKGGKVGVFCLETGILEQSLALREDQDDIIMVAGFSDCRRVVLAGETGDIYFWEYRDPNHSKALVLLDQMEYINDNEKLIEVVEPSILWDRIFKEYVYPINGNILHILAYLNEVETIRKVIRLLKRIGQGYDMILQKDLFGNTVLDVLLDEGDLTTAFHLLEILITNPPDLQCFCNIQEVIQKISKIKYPWFGKLLDSRLINMNHRYNKEINVVKENQYLTLFSTGYFPEERTATIITPVLSSPEELYSAGLLVRKKQKDPSYSAEINIVDIPNFLKVFEGFAVEENMLKESKVAKLAIEHKWSKYGSWNYCMRLAFYAFVMLTLVVYSVWLLPLRVRFINDFSKITRYGLVNLVFLCFLSLFVLLYLLSELYKLITQGLRYFSYLKHLYHFLSISLFTVMLIFDWLGLFNVYFDEDLIRSLHAFNLFFFIFGILFFLKPFRSFIFGRIFFKVLENIKGLLLVLLIIIYSFGFVIFILDQSWSFDRNGSDESTVVYWKEQFETFDLVYRLMIRDFNAYDYQTKPLYPIMLWVFFLMATFLIIMVIVNVFIAVVFELQQEMRGKGEVDLLKERWEILWEMDRTIIKGKSKEYLAVASVKMEENAIKSKRRCLENEKKIKELES